MDRPSDQGYRLRGHIVSPRSVEDIRSAAMGAQTVLGLSEMPPSMPDFLESLTKFGITVDVLDDDRTLTMAGVEAMCVPETATIILTENTYAAARRDDPRTRFTIFHELGHFVLQHTKVLPRKSYDAKPYLDSEWQADQFAAEITMSLETIRKYGLNTPTAIARFFRVSFPAANKRHAQLRRKNLI
ncbi:ImmA/IrrE family metallo-endopeptidase [Comamonas squillarum]|uniref:ImmA/IrrE family metallo-endopeptidase n=1 Tax=Comamonas squillarum TaxID=2977320 RepID=A0ABY6A2Y9_9BURK|nr:ImmA/IrrE family metallo-endopeptidase [Comamonas sp. PR12]UXC20043.1 ImmA/IrrE family metallo-endopeptidase [Comamonas sp. PR12]